MADNITVGYIGLGMMGGRMATNLQKAGYKLVVHDLHRQSASHHLQAGAEWAEHAARARREIATSSSPRCLNPPTSNASRSARMGSSKASKRAPPISNMSTNAQSVVKKISDAFAAKGAHMLDAPVSGGPQGAASRKMAIWVSGDKASFDKFKPVLDAMGDKPAYIGGHRQRHRRELVHNMSGYAITCALAETFTMGVKAGMDPVALWEAVRQGVGGRRLTFDGLLDQFLPGKYDPANFALKLATKDVKARDRARPRARRAHAHLQSHLRRDDGKPAIAAGRGATCAW